MHPNKVRKYVGVNGLLAKNDILGSKLLYEYATHFSPAVKIDYSSPSQEKLHFLIKRREQIILFKTQEIGRLGTAGEPSLLKSIKFHIKYLDKELEQINYDIDHLCKVDLDI